MPANLKAPRRGRSSIRASQRGGRPRDPAPTSQRENFCAARSTPANRPNNLDLEFNSLDAQREACEAYSKSQAHEGWRLIPNRYDDGAFSDASLDRPALQAILAEVKVVEREVARERAETT